MIQTAHGIASKPFRDFRIQSNTKELAADLKPKGILVFFWPPPPQTRRTVSERRSPMTHGIVRTAQAIVPSGARTPGFRSSFSRSRSHPERLWPIRKMAFWAYGLRREAAPRARPKGFLIGGFTQNHTKKNYNSYTFQKQPKRREFLKLFYDKYCF